jgi:hypothetical protein
MKRRGPSPGVNKRLRDVFRPNTRTHTAALGAPRCSLGHPMDFTKLDSTYSLVEVDRVFARDNVSDGAALGLAGRLLAACFR